MLVGLIRTIKLRDPEVRGSNPLSAIITSQNFLKCVLFIYAMGDIKLVILDHSGVISDDFPVTLYRINTTLDYFGKETIDKDFISRSFAPHLFNFYSVNFPDLDAEKCISIHKGLLLGAPKPKPLPGAIDAVKKMYCAGLVLCIFSSHPADKLVEEHEAFGSIDFFTLIRGDIDKSEPDKLLELISNFYVPLKNSFYFGDTTIDAKLAKMAGINFCAVHSDYQSYSQLRQVVSEDRIFNSLAELADLSLSAFHPF